MAKLTICIHSTFAATVTLELGGAAELVSYGRQQDDSSTVGAAEMITADMIHAA